MRIDSTPGGLAAALRMPAGTAASSAAFNAVLAAAQASAAAINAAGITPARDRLELSPQALAAILGADADPRHIQLVQGLLKALSGSSGQPFEVFSLRVQSEPAGAGFGTDEAGPGDMLRRVLMGTVQSADQHLLACSVALRFLPQLLNSDWGRSLASEGSGLALPRFMLESDLPLLQLLGQQLKFECVADARGLWPLQAQVLSGLVRFGSRVDDGRESPSRRKPQATEDGDEALPDETAATKAAPIPEPDDGGPPRISAGRWAHLSVIGAFKRLWARWGSFD